MLGCCEPGRLAVRLAELEDVVFFEPTGLITPLPLLGQVDGKLLARPVRKGFSSLANPLQVCLVHEPALHFYCTHADNLYSIGNYESSL